MERRAAVEEAVAHLPLMLTVEQARDVLGIGRSLAYSEVRRYLATDGREGIPAVRIGSAIRIPRAGLVDLMLAAAAPTGVRAGDAARVVRTHAPRRHTATDRVVAVPALARPRSGDVAQLPFAEPTGS